MACVIYEICSLSHFTRTDSLTHEIEFEIKSENSSEFFCTDMKYWRKIMVKFVEFPPELCIL